MLTKSIFLRIALMASALSLMSGCYTEYHMCQDFIKGKRYAENGSEIVEHYQSSICGWYLFDTFPLVTGDIEGEHDGFMSFFHDYVKTDLMIGRFDRYLGATGTRPVATAILNDDSVTFEIPGLSIAIPVILPYVFCYREVQISAVLVKKEGPNETGE